MTRKKPKKDLKVPRKLKVRRSITKDHRNKYAEKSRFKHTAWGTRESI